MQSLKDALALLEQVEKILSSYNPKGEEDKNLLNLLITKNMKIEAEAYAKYIRS
ncbi:hypothetical protein L3N51_00249 [Metallosphaera sp. J1]|uniref:hypothetical protein n=1 Tax=Metallosphaera TaxID=41980 RepID=UPI001EE019EA|nr:hypothetical protein [Metallosphaera javensis (ex Hofmann et al. 2022)]MCG3107974.1 hypothetical protein [Metallosphaera javensis (ex Hofmann et al. 2022)]BCS91874.1 MAG: hypothetical protein MjAS7_0482 [Metallosphaera javensis (ex Sakai et al. 2022)]